MVLMQSVPDETMPVAGFERHTFMCSDCQDVEQRLVFVKPSEQVDPEPVTLNVAPPIAPAAVPEPAAVQESAAAVEDEPTATVEDEPAATVEDEPLAAPGILMRVFSKLRGRRATSP
jgi:hypothetical protein